MRPSNVDIGLLFVALVWGFSPIVFTVMLAVLHPLAFVLVRFIILSIVATAILAIRGWRGGRAWQIEQRDIGLLIVSGLAGYGFYQLFYMVGLSHTTAFSSALLVTTLPIFSAIILALAKVERITSLQWIGIAVSFSGILLFLLLANGHGSEGAGHHLTAGEMLLGDGLTLAGTALFAIYGIVNRQLAQRYSPPELMCYTLLVGTVALLPWGIPAILSQPWQHVTWQLWALILYSVFFPIYITYSIWNWAIGQRGVAYVTIYSYLVPVLTGVFGWIILKQALSAGQIIAGVIVLGGMLVARAGIMRWQRHQQEITATVPASSPLPESAASTPNTPVSVVTRK